MGVDALDIHPTIEDFSSIDDLASLPKQMLSLLLQWVRTD